MLVVLLACSAPDRWPEARDACSESDAACEAVLDEHFGLEVTGEYRDGTLEGLLYMVQWDLGEECPDWAPDGENGAACFYNEAAKTVRQTIFNPEQPLFSLSQHTLEVGSSVAHWSPFNFGINLAGELTGYCGAVWIGEQGLAGASEEDEVLFDMASSMRADECDDPWVGE